MFEEISIQHQDVSAKVAPQRGGLITSLMVGRREVLYLDRETFVDSSKNVRGGIPVLFPFAGRLNDGIFQDAGTKMNQHGFGRNMCWQVVERRPYLLRMVLLSGKETVSQYPYNFVAEQSCLILPAGLHVELLICNMDAKSMPVSAGWHPYFSCPADQKQEVTTRMPGWDASRLSNDKEFDFGLPAAQNGRARFQIPRLGTMELSFNPRMRHLQFWSLPGKPFICIEPFLGPNNTINTAQRLDIPPGEARTFWMKIELPA